MAQLVLVSCGFTKQLKNLLLAHFLDGTSNWTAKKPQLSSKQIRGTSRLQSYMLLVFLIHVLLFTL